MKWVLRHPVALQLIEATANISSGKRSLWLRPCLSSSPIKASKASPIKSTVR